ncbi:MAG TPA: NADH:flavin oxidoreductase [Kofleriaceae bacterium]|jgi:2,4-dienoyl-CoA reductase-like NADH-dependent reductase (Old Yellow Enzyme family)|nr:NADH:flavin oxidoreductase [Kofleriaceae bacterium]
MWQPPERIKHARPETSWPRREDVAGALLFQPVQIGPRTAATRTWIPAMVPWRATEDGFVTPDVIDWYRRFAEGKPGVLVVEATGIRDIPSGPLLRIGHDRFCDGLARLVEAVREGSGGETQVLIQLIDFLSIRRRPARDKYFARFLTISGRHREALLQLTGDPEVMRAREDELRQKFAALPDADLPHVLSARELEDLERGYRERVTDTHLPHIRELPQVLPGLFADAADRAIRAGFDGVELHFAHAYTMASFLSALNTRDDGYGGSREHRMRLPREVVAAVRARVGRRGIVGCRFLGDDVIEGGNHLGDATWFGVELARAGFEFLSISKGGKFEDAKQPKVGWASYPYTGQSGYECMPTIYSDAQGPFARNVNLAAAIRAAVRGAGYETPIVTAGGICEFAQAEAVLQRGDADIIASARQSLADPDWFLKIREGRGSEIRRCEFTNYCEALDQQHKQVTCKLWDREALDAPDVTLASDGKRRLIAPRSLVRRDSP